MLLYNVIKKVKLHNKYTNKRNTISTADESDFMLGISKQWFVLFFVVFFNVYVVLGINTFFPATLNCRNEMY